MNRVVAVTGASGFVGREVVRALQERGAKVVAMGRSAPVGFPAEVETRCFDPNGAANPAAFEGADAVVHLAGESVSGRWTPEKKRRIAESRIDGTRTLVESLAQLAHRPSVVVSSSAVGYYGDRGDEPLSERSVRGNGFLADVCAGWEGAARGCEALDIRTVRMRTGIVLGNGGALAQMQVPFEFFAGGPLGSGRQFVPWIHVRDLAALYCFAIENSSLNGAVNAVTPDYATNARLSQAIGEAMWRPSLLPAPRFALRAVLGEFAGSLLASQLIMPVVAEDAGFSWGYPQLEAALAGIVRGSTGGTRCVRQLSTRQFVPRPLNEVFAFFSDARNLEAITPPSLSFSIRNAPPKIERGSLIEYDLRLHGFPIRWKSMIALYEPMRRFVDVQLRGPYQLWRHLHEFKPVAGGTEVSDTVDYVLPYAPFGDLAGSLVARDVANIFRFRHESIARRFQEPSHRRNHPASAIAQSFMCSH